MSSVDGECDYKLKQNEPETWGGEPGDECHIEREVLNEDGEWSCPRDAEEDKNFCIFHRDVDDNNDEKMKALLDIFETVSKDSDNRQSNPATEFIGARFARINLEEVTTVEPYVRFDHACVEDGIDAEEVCFKNGISARGLTIETDGQGNQSYAESDHEGESPLEKEIGNEHHGEFPTEDYRSERNVSFCQAEFRGPVEFDGANFGGAQQVSFAHTEFNGDSDVSFEGTNFTNQGHVAFNKADFENQGDIFFEGAVFENGDVSFSVTDFANDGDVWFRNVKFRDGGNVIFYDSDFFNPAGVDFTCVTLRNNPPDDRKNHALEFTESKFTEDIEIGVRAVNDETISFVEADLSGANLTVKSLPNVDFERANLTRVDLSEVDLTGANLEKALLNQANLFDTTLAGARLKGTVFGEAQVNERTFKNLEPDISPDSGSELWKKLKSWIFGPTGDDAYRCTYDPDYVYNLPAIDWDKKEPTGKSKCDNNEEEDDPEAAGGVYRQFEQLARDNALPDWQEQFFLLRQHMQTRQKNGVAYGFARFQRMLWGHSERFGRVIGLSGFTILAFAVINLFGGWISPVKAGGELGEPIVWTRLADTPMVFWHSLYYSMLTFTALGFENFRPNNTVGQLLTITETVFGAIFVAMFVFVLGRRAAR